MCVQQRNRLKNHLKNELILAPPRIDSSRESKFSILVPEHTLSHYRKNTSLIPLILSYPFLKTKITQITLNNFKYLIFFSQSFIVRDNLTLIIFYAPTISPLCHNSSLALLYTLYLLLIIFYAIIIFLLHYNSSLATF